METLHFRGCWTNPATFFFNHFPARGWKRQCSAHPDSFWLAFSIISPQGDGNKRFSRNKSCFASHLFQSFPRKGMETEKQCSRYSANNLFQSFPRKGMETFNVERVRLILFRINLFQSFPRKGMETRQGQPDLSKPLFFNHFPARGWKPCKQGPEISSALDTFSIISPQGDGNAVFLEV